MSLLRRIIIRWLPTKDTYVLELRRKIKNLTEENKNLRKEIEVLKKNYIKLYDEEIEDVIIENLQKAKKEICIAMAWLTSERIMKVLSELKSKGVYIKIITSNDSSNGKVRYINICDILKIVDFNKQNRKSKNMMHNKYCIIDNKKVIDGSYNWSKHAKFNIEHIIVIDNVEIADMYKESFEKIFNNPQYYSNYTISKNVI